MSTERVYGIDLGTTYSCIAYVDDAGRPVVIPNLEGDNTTPSVVYFEDVDRYTVGKEARNVSRMYPDLVAAFVKQHMGDDGYRFTAHGKEYRAPEVSAIVLKEVVQDAAQTVGPITDVVITVPAYFGAPEREATRQAGVIAGLTVRGIIPEPTAAAICYGAQQTADQTVLVYDLGGGTFDVTVIRVAGGHITVEWTDGNHQLGGKDWDDGVTQFFAAEFQKACPGAGDPMDDAVSLQGFALAAEEAKRALTAKQKDARFLQHAGKQVRVEITRAQFEELTDALLAQTLTLTRSVLAKAKDKQVPPVDKVLLVGGSSKMPYVKRRVREVTGIEPELFEPDQSVAKGAALYGMNLHIKQMGGEFLGGARDPAAASADELKRAQQRVAEETGLTPQLVAAQPTVTNVTPKGYGVVAHDASRGGPRVKFVLPGQSRLPADYTQTFATREDNQTSVDVRVMEQGGGTASEDVQDNREITKGLLTGLPPNMPRGYPIECNFKLEVDGTLRVRAWDPKTGRELRLEAKVAGVMSAAEQTMARNELALAAVA